MRIILVGGGTGGATTPLLALASELRRKDHATQLLFVGTEEGLESRLAASRDIPFRPIQAGKLRRYFSLQNFLDFFRVIAGFFQSLRIIRTFRPDVIVGVGSFVQVPMVWAGRLRRVPTLIHQQDITPGLANRICTPAATTITVAFEQSLRDFPEKKTRWVGNPIRQELLHGDPQRSRQRFELHNDLPVLLAFGGGTGALSLNQLIASSGLKLVTHFQIMHLTGGRQDEFRVQHPNYHAFEFLTNEMADAYAVADIVVCRAGLSTISEIAALGKPTVVIPLPGSSQESNAAYLEKNKAAVVLREQRVTSDLLVKTLLRLIGDPDERQQLSMNIHKLSRLDATNQFISEIHRIADRTERSQLVRELSSVVRDIRVDEQLANYTYFRIGGPAEVFVVCRSVKEIVNAARIVHRHQRPLHVLGGGANTVVADHRIRGVVLQIRNEEFTVTGNEVIVGAGMNTGQCVSRCLKAGLTGLEFIVGIYGTIGGAVRGNAGAFRKEMKDVVVSCDVLLPSGTITTMTREQLNFSYRDSVVKHQNMIILSVRLRLNRGDVAEARQRILEYGTYKQTHQPLGYPSAGCLFKNYELKPGDEKLRTIFATYINNNRIPAWALIVEAGVSGKRIGDIQISETHANFFINHGRGTAEQIVMLVSLVKQQVRDRFSVQLQEEVQFMGF